MRRRPAWIDRLLFFIVLSTWGLLCFSWSVLAPAPARLLPRPRREALGQNGIRIGFRFLLWLMQWTGLCRFDLSALDALGADEALVIASNHPSLLDAVLVTARLPRTVCISKASLWNNPFLGGGIRLAGYLRNDSPLALIRAGADSLARRHHLLVFPEGTRTDPGIPVRHFRGGFAVMAKAADVPVQTILIETDNPYLTKGWPLWRMPPLPIVHSVRLGRRFAVKGDTKRFVSDLEDYFRAELESAAQQPARRASSRTIGTGRLHQPA